MIRMSKTSNQTQQRGHAFPTCTVFTEVCLVLPSLIPCYYLNHPGRQLLKKDFIVYVFFSFRPNLPRFPLRAYNSCGVSCASPPLLHPRRFRLRFRPRPCLVIALVSIPSPDPVPILCSSTGFHPRSRSYPVLAPVPVSIICHFAHLHPILVPAPSPSPSPFTSPTPTPFPSTFSPPPPIPPVTPFVPSRPSDPVNQYNAHVQTPSLTNGAVGCLQAPPPVCRDDGACDMKLPAVKQNRIAAEDVLLPSPPPDAGTRWSVSSTCALPV